MAIVLVHEGPTVTRENYDKTVAALTGGKTKMESLSDWPVEGILMHSAGQGPNGFRIVDVWESQDQAKAFQARVMELVRDMVPADTPGPTRSTSYELHDVVRR